MKILTKLFQNKEILVLIFAVLIFFYPFFLQGKIPIPADTIVGMYHPWKDIVWDNLTSGVPFKNFLITDPVRQQYVWRKLSIEQLKIGQLPFWNPYSFSGTPLLANFQSAVFYPGNILFFILPFDIAWGLLVILQPFLASVFLYLYLKTIGVSKFGSMLGSIIFAFSGFSIAWLEWNTLIHTALWLPLTLLTVEKIIQSQRGLIIWCLIFIFSLTSSFFAGHLQIFFYSFLVIIGYIIFRVLSLKKNKLKVSLFFILCSLFFILVTSIQWLPTLQFINESSRYIDQGSYFKAGWFIPWQNLIQFLIPDFFGNPATNNYFGVWNYAEFVGFIGVLPLILALYSLIFLHKRIILFFTGLLIAAFVFSLPTPLAMLPFSLKIPLISTSQPTRLIFIADFALSILAAFGFDSFIKEKQSKKISVILTIVGSILFLIIILIYTAPSFNFGIEAKDLPVSKRNIILPAVMFLISTGLLISYKRFVNKWQKAGIVLIFIFICFDLFRFGWKFLPFSKREWIYPDTAIISQLKEDKTKFRIMSTDRRIMPPNFSNFYGLEDVSGYDPLYLSNYSRLVASWERKQPDIADAPFNRIITPSDYDSFITDLLGVKYILSLDELKTDKLIQIGQEGDTRLYLNNNYFPGAFLTEEVVRSSNDREQMEKMFALGSKLRYVAVSNEYINVSPAKINDLEYVKIVKYDDNYMSIQANTTSIRLLAVTDIYYPSVKVFIDGKESKLLRVDFAFRGVVVPKGLHSIEFKMAVI